MGNTKTTVPAIIPAKAVVVRQNEQVEVLIAQAIDKGTPVETMEKLLAMRRELKAEFAKECFDDAMAKFQGECSVIKKEKAGGQTKGGVVAYYYAPIEMIVAQVKDLIQKHGFSYSIKTETKEKGVKVTCIVKHTAGHSEFSDVEVPLSAGTSVMSAPQIVAAALTFAKRYAFCNAFGILTGDNDAQNNDQTINQLEGKINAEFKKVMDIVGKSSIVEMEGFKKKMAESKKYTPEQKEEFSKVVEQRIVELKKAVK